MVCAFCQTTATYQELEAVVKFGVEEVTSWEAIEHEVRNVRLLELRDGQIVYPYADANIDLREVAYYEVKPTSLYVVRDNLARQAQISRDLVEYGYNPLELESGLVLTQEGQTERVGLTPPFVEETKASGQYVLDGAHRTGMGRWLGRVSFVCIHVSNIRDDCPAYALPNEWDQMLIYDEVPKDRVLRKRYVPDAGKFYRDYGPLNGSRPRK